MNLPVGGEKSRDIRRRKKLRRAVGAINHPQRPYLRKRRAERGGQLIPDSGGGARRQMQHVAAAQRPSAVAAKLTEGKGAFTAQIVRHLNTAAQAEIASDPCAAYRAKLQRRPRRNGKNAVQRLVNAIERHRQRRAAHHRLNVGIKFQGRPVEGDFQRGLSLGITQQTVAETQGVIVHRPRRRYAHRPVPETSRIVLHAGLGPGAQHLHGGRPVAQLLKAAGPGLAFGKRRKAKNLQQVQAVGFYAVQAGLRQRLRQAGDSLIAAGAPGDRFRQHRVEKRRHFAAGFHPAVDTQGGAVRRWKDGFR